MKQYQDLMRTLLNAPFKGDRTGTGTFSKFGHSMRFNLQEGFPLVTSKFVPMHLIIKELLWFLEGNTNAHDLAEQGCHIWDEWATEEGDLGPIYGKQWRSWECPPNYDRVHEKIDELMEGVEAGEYDKQDLMNALDNLRATIDNNNTIDQIREVIHTIKTKPNSRRLIVSAWNPNDMPDETVSPQENVEMGNMALAACHTLFQFYVSELTDKEKHTWFCQRESETYWDLHRKARIQPEDVDGVPEADRVVWKNVGADIWYHKEAFETFNAYARDNAPKGKLSCQLYQRSADAFIGVPFNIASYALLTHMIAQCCELEVGDFIWTGGDCHIYSNHVEQTRELISRDPLPLSTLKLNPEITDIDAFTLDDIEVVGYHSHSAIKGKVSV